MAKKKLGTPIPDEILEHATPDMLQMMGFACFQAGNQFGLMQVAVQWMLRSNLVATQWVYGKPGEKELEKRRKRE